METSVLIFSSSGVLSLRLVGDVTMKMESLTTDIFYHHKDGVLYDRHLFFFHHFQTWDRSPSVATSINVTYRWERKPMLMWLSHPALGKPHGFSGGMLTNKQQQHLGHSFVCFHRHCWEQTKDWWHRQTTANCMLPVVKCCAYLKIPHFTTVLWCLSKPDWRLETNQKQSKPRAHNTNANGSTPITGNRCLKQTFKRKCLLTFYAFRPTGLFAWYPL